MKLHILTLALSLSHFPVTQTHGLTAESSGGLSTDDFVPPLPPGIDNFDLEILSLIHTYESEKNYLESQLSQGSKTVGSNVIDRIRKRIKRLGDMLETLTEWARALCSGGGKQAACASSGIGFLTRCVHDPDVTDCWDQAMDALRTCCTASN